MNELMRVEWIRIVQRIAARVVADSIDLPFCFFFFVFSSQWIFEIDHACGDFIAFFYRG